MNLILRRRHMAGLIAIALAGVTAPAMANDDDADERDGLRSGNLFISTNGAAGNEVLVYKRSNNAAATLRSRLATQGMGTGAGLGSQGAVVLSRNGRFLFVVNAASNTVSTFAVRDSGLVLRSVVDSGGLRPTSVTEYDGLVYVLNANGSGNVTGFRNDGGTLRRVNGAVGTLSANTGTAPAQVGFSEDGEILVVTERNTNTLTSYLVRPDGTLQQKTVTPSQGAVPFGFAFTRRDVLVVSEAAGSSVSSYRFGEGSALPQAVTSALPNQQGAACWISVTPNGRFAFSANAATSNVSSFSVARNGQLSLLASVAGTTSGAGALDMAVSPSGTQLHVFASRAPQIVSFTITPAGALLPLGSVSGVPAGSAGLAAN
jgi:6-phosphogluconolactonase